MSFCREGMCQATMLRYAMVPLLTATVTGCHRHEEAASEPTPEQQAITSVPEIARYTLEGLRCPVHVVRTEGHVPHVYAKDRVDLARAFGFVQARDRYFEMELARRLGKGTLSELLGDAALSQDMEARATGMAWVAGNLRTHLSAEHQLIFDGFAEGVNAYIARVADGQLPPPSELKLAGPLLGAASPTDLMKSWSRGDVAAVAAVLVYQLGYETDDTDRTYNKMAVDAGLFDGSDPRDALRNVGAEKDIWDRIEPVWSFNSAPGWGVNGAGAAGHPPTASARKKTSGEKSLVNPGLMRRLADRMQRFERSMGRGDPDTGWGSNVWAVSGDATGTGPAVVAGDGHLPLSVPSLFWQVGLDTSLFGGGDTHQLGLGFPGLPILAVGTNGSVAWSQTQLMGDITDWYAEQIQVGANGLPSASRFQGAWRPLQVTEESHEVANVPVLGSVGRSFTWNRFTTFDGRWITDMEGNPAEIGAPGSVDFPNGSILPADTNGDGLISAISFDYSAFSDGNLLNAVDRFGHASGIDEFREATKYLIAYSQNIGAVDSAGNVLYTGYQAVPCRTYLPRNSDGTWIAGADPRYLIDGTKYGAFTIPVTDDGRVDESQAVDPTRCVVPWADYPAAVSPSSGYVVSANNDPGGISADNQLTNDPWYIGGPWDGGWRAHRIAERLEAHIESGSVGVEAMAEIQADHKSALGSTFGAHLVEAITDARAAKDLGLTEGADGRLAALYNEDPEALDETAERIQTWLDHGASAESGVQTFYHAPTAEQEEASVATMLFNGWLSRWDDRVFGDEDLPHVWQGGGSTGRVRALQRMLKARNDADTELASFDPETGESAFFDIRGTPEAETSNEVAVLAMLDALAFLRGAPDSDVISSGFGNNDLATWKWGYRHWTKFQSVLAEFVDSSSFGVLTEQFAINTDVLPLEGEPGTDTFEWFPRPGDNFSVDAANSGWGDDFTHGYGPVFRMVIALDAQGNVTGQNVIPGGQSAIVDSPYFADQARLWLANEAIPLRFSPEQVAAGATGRELLVGSGASCE